MNTPDPADRTAIRVSDREPKPQDANNEGQVLAWDADKQQWTPRFWFDFPSHPAWDKQQRKEIKRRFPFWKPIL